MYDLPTDNLKYDNGQPLAQRMTLVMRRVYANMTFALLITALTSWVCYNSQLYWNLLESFGCNVLLLCIIELGLVVWMTSAIQRISTLTAIILFYAYAILNGVTLTPLFVVYTGVSVAKTFAITAAVFGAMSIFGYTTSQDLTSWGRMLFVALIGLLLALVVNLFMKSPAIDYLISCGGVLIFIGLTAWDTQKIKMLAAVTPDATVGKLAMIGALTLYLDFINLFLYLLRFFGRRS